MNEPAPRGMHNKSWSEERVMRLKELWAEGKTASEIGTEFGCTRSSVLGKIHRLGNEVEQRVFESEKIATAKRNYKRAPWAVDGVLANGTLRKPRVPKREPIMELPPELVENPVTFMQLEPHHCRWPVGGEPRDRLFCGATAMKDHSYCPHHCAVAYMKTERLTRGEHELMLRQMARARKAIAA